MLNTQHSVGDLFVSGTSIASGWGLGREQVNQPNNSSWVHYTANKLNCDNLWNHSTPSNPIELSVEDTIGFCTQYYDKYKSYSNLLVIVELSLPTGITVGNHLRFGSSTISDKVTPIIVPIDQNRIMTVDTPDCFRTIFVSYTNNRDYLRSKSVIDFVPPEDIHIDDYTNFKDNEDELFNQIKNKTTHSMYFSKQLVDSLQQWLGDRGIRYLFFWGCGKTPKYQKFVDHAFSDVYCAQRMIPMQEFSCFSKGAAWSENPINDHPDNVGHQRIADYICNYITNNDILRPINDH